MCICLFRNSCKHIHIYKHTHPKGSYHQYGPLRVTLVVAPLKLWTQGTPHPFDLTAVAIATANIWVLIMTHRS